MKKTPSHRPGPRLLAFRRQTLRVLSHRDLSSARGGGTEDGDSSSTETMQTKG